MKIHKSSLGNTGIEVSRLCLGTWQASGWSTSDEKLLTKTIHQAIECGINFFDTAYGYGNGYAEQLLGKALGDKRKSVVVATKAPLKSSRPDKLRKAVEQSLKDLGTDYIDLYQQHWPPPAPPLEETIGEMERLKEEGKIRAVGVSNWTEEEWSEIDDPSRIDTLQPCYSLLWRHIESSVLPLCKEHNIGVLPYSPLCQGLLSGKFRSKDDVPKDTRKNNVLVKDTHFDQVLNFLSVIDEVAAAHESYPAVIAIAWLFHQDGVTSVITGCSRPEQLEMNIRALEISLSAEELKLLDKESKKFLEITKKYKSLWNWHPKK